VAVIENQAGRKGGVPHAEQFRTIHVLQPSSNMYLDDATHWINLFQFIHCDDSWNQEWSQSRLGPN
jgi:hypothetical protein